MFKYTRDRWWLAVFTLLLGFLLLAIFPRLFGQHVLLDSVETYFWISGALLILYDRARNNWPYPFATEIDLLERSEKAIESGDYSEALRVCRQARARHPRNSDTLYDLGHILNKIGKYQEAIRYLKFAHELAPEFPETLIELGYSYRMIAEIDKAIVSFEHALLIDPENEDALSQLAVCNQSSAS
jgi:tetratricopeptide (TPR) repeat protein